MVFQRPATSHTQALGTIHMTTKLLKCLTILIFASCEQNGKLPESFKIGLIDFSVSKSRITQQIESGKTLEFGTLWSGFNKINTKSNQDTLIVDVNVELSTTLNYDGGFEVARDTLFLYAKRLERTDIKETVHSTLIYKILLKGQTYKEIEFKETN